MGNRANSVKKVVEDNLERRRSSMPHMPSFNLSNVRLPRRIILIRHGESLGNADETAYERIPDWKIPLTEKGIAQARDAGAKIKELIGDKPIAIYCSPYLRTKQTLAEIMNSIGNNHLISAREEPRLTEQQFGNFQTSDMKDSKSDRNRFGRFYYRFPNGESGLEVYNRLSSFISTLFRDWQKDNIRHNEDYNVLLVTHGLLCRLFIMRWFLYTVEEFEASLNPPNGSVLVMERRRSENDGMDHFFLTDESQTLCGYCCQHRHSSDAASDPREDLTRIISNIKFNKSEYLEV